ncbi:hypothetical protein LTR62_000766 [Meristemomyces frigidus]|uniref:Uncharacterized protein n=1 Tax=Meristemomyces frigidus TaxID=1508187 RepID=A0AAN7YIF6_9PEZI|nr:hypothetical protein LTR62_000766 [Meristemomyces frigidus]
MQAVDRSTHVNAQVAATGAFYNQTNHHRERSLSSAAAAAALRSLTTTPEPVGSIQTKRMQRGSLQRNSSSGSMTDRTFRSPSPASRNGRLNGAVSPAPDAPPVPALPRHIPKGQKKRSASVEPPQRVLSPPPRGGRGSSVDQRSGRASFQDTRLSGLAEHAEEEEQGDGYNSRNFSRPISSQPGSPTPSSMKKYTHGTGSWFAQPETNNVPARPSSAASRRLQSPGRGEVDPNVVSYVSGDALMVWDPNTRKFTAKPRVQPAPAQKPIRAQQPPPAQQPKPAQKPISAAPQNTGPSTPQLKPGSWDPSTRSIVPWRPEEPRTTQSDADTKRKSRPVMAPIETQLQPPPRNPARLSPTSSSSPTSPRHFGGQLHHQPSVVREDPEGEEQEALSSPPAKGHLISTSMGPAVPYTVRTPQSHQRAVSLDVPRGAGSGRGRNGSMSPTRSAHFSSSLVTGTTRHNPPLRAASPAKSAMKHSPASSVRTTSPMATFSPARPKAPPSEVSDITSEASEDGAGSAMKSGKKKARVSFNEEPREIDAAGAIASPKALSAMGNHARSPIDDDGNDFATPRPALPSFGSVRRDRGDARTEMPEKVTEVPPERNAVSSDHAIGGIISSAQKISAVQRGAPLPPDITSKEPSGAISDESEDEGTTKSRNMATVSQNGPLPAGTQPVQPRRVSVDELEPKARDFATQPTVAERAGDHVPDIKLQPPTPGEDVGKQLGDLEESAPAASAVEPIWASEEVVVQPRRSLERFVVPGGWATEDNSTSKASAAKSTVSPVVPEQRKQKVEPAVARPADPVPTLYSLDEESDDSAAFSDAAEDLSDLEDGGFASLNAIVSSPVASPRPREQERKSMTEGPNTTRSAPVGQMANAEAGGDGVEGDEWKAATAYWSKLSRQQRDQIEREHMSDDDEPPVISKTKKKTTARRMTGQVVATQKKENADQQPPFAKTLRGQEDDSTAAGGDGEVHMRRSMRGNSVGSEGAGPASGENGVHMRQSMRGNTGTGTAAIQAGNDGEVHMRKSMRGNTGAGTSMPSTMRSGQRPQSAHTPAQQQDRGSSRPMSADGSSVSRLGANGLPLKSQQQTRPTRARVDSDGSLRGSQASQDSSFPSFGAQQPRTVAQRATPQGAYTAKLQQKVANDSDSESSFKKKKRTGSAAGGQYTMNRSMRAGSVGAASIDARPLSPPPEAKRGGGAFSIRSLSPNGRGVFGGKEKGEKLRSSLRSGSVDASATRMSTLRSGRNAPAPTMRSGSGKPAAAAVSKPRFRSRFVDSDDEDEGAGRGMGFSSRFVDSDDDGPTSPGLRPVRGIPRRAGQDDGDSTDLEDEDNNDARGKDAKRGSKRSSKGIVTDDAAVEKAMEAARRNLGIAAPGKQRPAPVREVTEPLPTPVTEQAPVVATRPPLEPATPDKKKRSFMGSILRRNRSSQASVQQVRPSSPIPPSPAVTSKYISPQVPAPQQAAGETSAPSTPSKGKLVRRESGQPSGPPPTTRTLQRGESWMSGFSTATAPTSMGQDWPLHGSPVPKIPGSASAQNLVVSRPQTSDGTPNPEAVRLARTMRTGAVGSGIGSGRSVGFAQGSKEEDGDGSLAGGEGSALAAGGLREGGSYSRRTGKKKKFGLLRKAFGLYD